MMRAVRTAASAAVLFMMVACASSGASRLQGLDADALYEVGHEAMRAGDWSDAIQAFERFTLQFPTHARVQEARYRLGEAHMHEEEYITAANEFSRLADDFPAGPWADDSRFKVCEAYYELSPDPQLDQEYTIGALDHCQSLISYYPDSEYVERARTMHADLTNKLAEKLYQAGDFYMNRGAIDSAIIYYESALDQYPDTAVAPRALLRLYEAYTEIGYTTEADAARERLLRDFPESAEAGEVRGTATADAP
ncbi:MAG: outer membrane protein assembly factor BamD [Longimicrobiales bacterium]